MKGDSQLSKVIVVVQCFTGILELSRGCGDVICIRYCVSVSLYGNEMVKKTNL